jgi:hypothetical protein
MKTEMRIPRPLYYFVLSLVTQVVLAIFALAIVVPIGLLGQLPWSMIGFLFAYNVVIATLIALALNSHSPANEAPMTRGCGLVLGHLVGLLVGGFLGLKLGGFVWSIAAAAVLYFAFGWIGSRISAAVGAYLDRGAVPASPLGFRTAFRLTRPKDSSLFLYGAIIPGILMAAAILLRSSGLAFAQYPAVLPTARTALVVLSLISIIIPWVQRVRVVPSRQNTVTRGSALWLIGLGLSLAPAFYGFLLFVAFDMSIAELSLFAVVASMAATAWGASRLG